MGDENTQLADCIKTINIMTRYAYIKDTEHAANIYEIISQLFLYLITGDFSKPLVIQKAKVSFLEDGLNNKDDLLLPQASQDDYKESPQIVYSDRRFIHFNKHNLGYRVVLVDYLKLLTILPIDQVVEPHDFNLNHWGNAYWDFIHLLSVAADTYFNTFWSQQRGLSIIDVEQSDTYQFYKTIADSVYLFFSNYLPLCIPCPYCVTHYLELMNDDFFALKECIYQSRPEPNWSLSHHFYYLHNLVNVSLSKQSYPMEEFINKKENYSHFIKKITDKSKESIKQIPISINLDLTTTQNGTWIKWFN